MCVDSLPRSLRHSSRLRPPRRRSSGVPPTAPRRAGPIRPTRAGRASTPSTTAARSWSTSRRWTAGRTSRPCSPRRRLGAPPEREARRAGGRHALDADVDGHAVARRHPPRHQRDGRAVPRRRRGRGREGDRGGAHDDRKGLPARPDRDRAREPARQRQARRDAPSRLGRHLARATEDRAERGRRDPGRAGRAGGLGGRAQDEARHRREHGVRSVPSHGDRKRTT